MMLCEMCVGGCVPALKVLVEQGEGLASNGLGQKESMKPLVYRTSQLNFNAFQIVTQFTEGKFFCQPSSLNMCD